MIPIIPSNIIEKLKACAPPITFALPNGETVKIVDTDWINSPIYFPYYYTYGRLFKPRTILEFGVFAGQSLFAMISGSQDSGVEVTKVTGVDNESYVAGSNEDASYVIRHCYKGELELISADIHEAKISDEYDLVSLDCHDRDELQIAWKSVKRGGFCIIDDIGSSYSDDRPEKAKWVFKELHEMCLRGEIAWFYWIDSYRGQFVIQKKTHIMHF